MEPGHYKYIPGSGYDTARVAYEAALWAIAVVRATGKTTLPDVWETNEGPELRRADPRFIANVIDGGTNIADAIAQTIVEGLEGG